MRGMVCVSRDTWANCGALCNSQFGVMSSNATQRETLKLPWSLLRAGGRHGLSDNETRDPMGSPCSP